MLHLCFQKKGILSSHKSGIYSKKGKIRFPLLIRIGYSYTSKRNHASKLKFERGRPYLTLSFNSLLLATQMSQWRNVIDLFNGLSL